MPLRSGCQQHSQGTSCFSSSAKALCGSIMSIHNQKIQGLSSNKTPAAGSGCHDCPTVSACRAGCSEGAAHVLAVPPRVERALRLGQLVGQLHARQRQQVAARREGRLLQHAVRPERLPRPVVTRRQQVRVRLPASEQALKVFGM